MAASPNWKVYNPSGEYIAACKHVEDAACLVAFYGDGATIRSGHKRVVWAEGKESQPASESYDYVATAVASRAHASVRLANKRTRSEVQS